MNLHFITSISKEYWESTAKKCINTWKLPGKLTVFIDQPFGDLTWLDEVPGPKYLLYVPPLKVDDLKLITLQILPKLESFGVKAVPKL